MYKRFEKEIKELERAIEAEEKYIDENYDDLYRKDVDGRFDGISDMLKDISMYKKGIDAEELNELERESRDEYFKRLGRIEKEYGKDIREIIYFVRCSLKKAIECDKILKKHGEKYIEDFPGNDFTLDEMDRYYELKNKYNSEIAEIMVFYNLPYEKAVIRFEQGSKIEYKDVILSDGKKSQEIIVSWN